MTPHREQRRLGRLVGWAVGSTRPRRVGAVFGYVGGVAVSLLGIWVAQGYVGNLDPMVALGVGGPVGSLVGFALGGMAERKRIG
jgi:hypothetical protein